MGETKENKKNIEVTHHIVYSTKGGCGKTAFSLYLTLCKSFDKKEQNGIVYYVPKMSDDGDHRECHYLIDLDLLGSSLEYSTHINKTENGVASSFRSPCLQELLNKDKRVSDIESWKQHDEQKVYHGEEIRRSGKNLVSDNIYIVPVGASEREKAMFHVKKGTTPLLRYEELEAQLDGIQQSIILLQEQRPSRNRSIAPHIHIVYDLAPNADSYTDAVLDEIFGRVNKNKNNEKRRTDEDIVLYLVSNSSEMLTCNIDWVNTMMCGDKDRRCPVFLVCNDSVGYFDRHRDAKLSEYDLLIDDKAVDENNYYIPIFVSLAEILQKDFKYCSDEVKKNIKHMFFKKDSITIDKFKEPFKYDEIILEKGELKNKPPATTTNGSKASDSTTAFDGSTDKASRNLEHISYMSK